MGMISGPEAVMDMNVCQYAQMVKAGSRNGMSTGGAHRVIGEIPLAVYLALERVQQERGEPLTGQALKAFLAAHPEYRTVNAVDSGAKGQIRVNL